MSESSIAFFLEFIAFTMVGVVAIGVLSSILPARRRTRGETSIHDKFDRLIEAKKIRDEIRQQARADLAIPSRGMPQRQS